MAHADRSFHALYPISDFITYVGALAITANNVVADFNAMNAEPFVRTHARPLDPGETIDTARLNQDNSLIVTYGEKKDTELHWYSLTLPVIECSVLYFIGKKNFGVWGAACLTAARLIPSLIAEHQLRWDNPEEQDLSFLTFKGNRVTQPNNPVFVLAKLHVKLNKQSDVNNDCTLCLNANGKYSLCSNPRHAVHYACCLEYISQTWKNTPLNITQTEEGTLSFSSNLPTCPICRDPINPAPQTDFLRIPQLPDYLNR